MYFIQFFSLILIKLKIIMYLIQFSTFLRFNCIMDSTRKRSKIIEIFLSFELEFKLKLEKYFDFKFEPKARN